MRYTLLLHYPESNAEELGPEALAEGMRAFEAYAKALDAAGLLASAEVLQPSSATTTLTLAGGELVVAACGVGSYLWRLCNRLARPARAHEGIHRR